MRRRSPIPLYHQIASDLERQITSNAIPPNTMLPPEKELAARYGVSLVTVRAAMRILTDQRLIERRPGKGTTVLERQARAVWELGWLNDLIASMVPSHIEILSMGRVAAPHWVARRFGIDAGAPVYHMDTVRYMNGAGDKPFMSTKIYHPRAIGRLLHKRDFESEAAQAQWVIGVVEEKCGLDVANVRQTMCARLADRDAARRLGIAAGEPLLEVTRDYFDKSGRLVQSGRSVYRSGQFEYVLNLSRSRPPGRDGFTRIAQWDDTSRTDFAQAPAFD
jgi:DNA-binding GntR family transcriptional regulator